MVPREVNVDAWIGWLLQAHRLAAHPRSDAAEFARRLRLVGYRTDASFVARCEHGATRTPAAMISAYERVLGLPPACLTSICEWTSETPLDHTVHATELTREEVARKLAVIDERISDSTATGTDWLDLTSLTRAPNPVMLPATLAQDWGSQLLTETVRAVRTSRTTRLRALCRLLRNEQTREPVAETLFEFATAPGAADPTTALGAIGTVDDARLIDRLIALLESPHPRIRRAAASSLFVPIARNRLTPAQAFQIQTKALQVCRDEPAHAAPIVMLASYLSPRLTSRLIQDLGRDPRALHDRQLPSAGLAQIRATMRASGDDDSTMPQLLHAVWIGRYPERRYLALSILGASPHRAALADTAVRLAATSSNPVDVSTAAMMLPHLAGAAHQSALLRLLTVSSPGVQPYILEALGRGADVPAEFSLRRQLHKDDTEASAVFAAGMSAHPELAAVADSARVSSETQQSARWWLAHGARIDDADMRQTPLDKA